MGSHLRFRQKLNKTMLVLALGIATVSVNGCDSFYWNEHSSIAQVQSQGEVVVLTTKNPLIYSKPKKGEPSGIDYDLIQNFAHHYNLKIKYVVLPNEEAVMRALYNGEGDFAAARLRTPSKNFGFLTGPAYEETHLSLYCHKKAKVQNIRDLNGKTISILSKDNYPGLSQRLRQLSPQADLQVLTNVRTPAMLKLLSRRKMDCVISENFNADYYSRYHRQIEKVVALSGSYSLSWLLKPNNQELLRLMQSWFQKASRADEILKVSDRYKNYVEQLDKNDVARFLKLTRTTLPTYRTAFRDAGLEHDLPWQLIASVAYQESHWNSEARSFTGVRGLMQLTTDTALYVGVEDRSDPFQSIWGGSKYLRYLMDRTPAHLNPKDRLALTLAAYNIGLAHLKDAQRLAERLGKNPHSWHQLREVLPLLANPDYAAELQYGPARGYETVDFVERVKSFYNLMGTAG